MVENHENCMVCGTELKFKWQGAALSAVCPNGCGTEFGFGELAGNLKETNKHGDRCSKCNDNERSIWFCTACRKWYCHFCCWYGH